jgi:hypothetical protein
VPDISVEQKQRSLGNMMLTPAFDATIEVDAAPKRASICQIDNAPWPVLIVR